VIYFLFIICLCVLSLTTTVCVMYLNLLASDVPVIPMRPWVCRPISILKCTQKPTWLCFTYFLSFYSIVAISPTFL